MLSLTYNKGLRPLQFYYDVYTTIQKNKPVFLKYCGPHAEYFMTDAYTHIINNYDSSIGNLNSYVCTLARTLIKQYKKNEILVDYNNIDEEDKTSAYYANEVSKSTSKDDNYDLEIGFLSLEEALNELKVSFPLELIYLQKSLKNNTVYADASNDFMILFKDIITQFGNVVDDIIAMDLSDIKKNYY